MQTEIQHFLHRCRKEHGQATGLEDVVALVRRCAALGHMVIAGNRQHTAPRRGAGHVAVLEHIGGAVHAGAFAIPNAKHAIELVVAGRRESQLLCAPQRGGGEFFIHPRLKHNVLRLQVLACTPQRLVIVAQR